MLLPSAFLFVTVLAFNLLGDALRARGQRVVTRGEAPVDVHVEVGTVPASGPLLEVHDLRVDFRLGGGTSAPCKASASRCASVSPTLAIIGESGSGKSVTARWGIMAWLPPRHNQGDGISPVSSLTGTVWPVRQGDVPVPRTPRSLGSFRRTPPDH